MAQTILSHPLLVEVVWPFILVFTLVFAILQKTEMLGKGKRQIDALISLMIAIITVSFGYATGIIISLIPFLAVAAVILLVFMLIYGMTFKPGEFGLNKHVITVVGILAAIGVIIAVMVATGAWDYVRDLINTGEGGSVLITNLVFIGAIIVAVVVALVGSKEKKS